MKVQKGKWQSNESDLTVEVTHANIMDGVELVWYNADFSTFPVCTNKKVFLDTMFFKEAQTRR